MRQPFKDHYETLGVSRGASARRILKARNELLRIHHPDRNPDQPEEAGRITVEILLAAEVLLDERQREEYDKLYDLHVGRPRGRVGEEPDVPVSEEEGKIVCPHCGRMNLRTGRGYCIVCGGGIGETPRPYRPHVFGVDFEKFPAKVWSDKIGMPRYFNREPIEVNSPILIIVSVIVFLFIVAKILNYYYGGFLFFLSLFSLIFGVSLIGVFLFLKWRNHSKGQRKK